MDVSCLSNGKTIQVLKKPPKGDEMNKKIILRLLLFFVLFGGLLIGLSLFFDLHRMFRLDHRELVRFIIIVFSTYTVVILMQRSLRLFFKNTEFLDSRREETIEIIFRTGSNLIAIIIVIVAAISPFVDLGKVLAGAGILGAVIGFGAQSLIKDFFYGVFFVYEHQFHKGDLITVNETAVGFVEEPGLRALKLRLIDGTLFTISNGEIRSISNGNAAKRRIDIHMVISYRENPARIREILEPACVELNERFQEILYRKEDGEPEEEFRSFGVHEFYFNGHGLVYRVVATVLDTEHFETNIHTKNFLADRLFEHGVMMAEGNIYFQQGGNPIGKCNSPNSGSNVMK